MLSIKRHLGLPLFLFILTLSFVHCVEFWHSRYSFTCPNYRNRL